MYTPDLSPYHFKIETIGDEHEEFGTLCVGFLDKKHTFVQGETSEAFQARLFEFCMHPVSRIRGFLRCEICDVSISSEPIHVQRGDQELWLGSGQIRVIYNHKIYAAPNLIYHYVIEHNYKPPDQFIEAVLNGPLPNSIEHQTMIDKMSIFLEI
ncbi:MAG: hypothetical protein GY941_05400 [Planctomycetes bacterium]|nr:hypothetical protein [Planctomycetota bacterium]